MRRQTAMRTGAAVFVRLTLVWLTLAVVGCGRPLRDRGADGGLGGSVGTGGSAGTNGDAGTTGTGGSAGTSGNVGTGGSAGTGGNAGSAGATSKGGAGGSSIGGTGGGGNAGMGGSTERKPLGAPCVQGTECASASCFDGVCCSTACTGACRSCALAGSIGTCAPVAAGSADPRASCAQQAPSTCGLTGKCDGSGACQRYPSGTVCAAATCVSNTLTPAAACDGQGTCRVPASVSCAPNGCHPTAGRCYAGCPDGDLICIAGSYCTGDESCYPKKDPGVACGTNHECKSGYCVDGACCGANCDAKCLSCTGTFALGTCTALSAGTVCAPGTCVDFVLTPPSVCNGGGLCVASTAATCAPYKCRTDAPLCRTDCATLDDCISGWTCMIGLCLR
jgi:hypothetical protein